MNRQQPIRSACGFAIVALLAGCSSASTGSITGTVTYNDEPVSWGTIAVYSDDGRVTSGVIQEGHYILMNAPLGPAGITVQAHQSPPMMTPPLDPTLAAKGRPEKRLAKFVRLPARYADNTKSGLRYDVMEGMQTHNIALQP